MPDEVRAARSVTACFTMAALRRPSAAADPGNAPVQGAPARLLLADQRPRCVWINRSRPSETLQTGLNSAVSGSEAGLSPVAKLSTVAAFGKLILRMESSATDTAAERALFDRVRASQDLSRSPR